jgi:serine/threonine-protein kinase
VNAPPGFRDSPERALGAGEVVASTFAIRDEIARTETGMVYEARDMMLDRILALKIAWRDPGTPSLILEARRCAAVHDPCAVDIHGMGMHGGVEYVVAERVTGRLLRDALAGPLPYDLYLPRLRTLVAAVAHAHDARIAIGEISGSTVLVCADPPSGSGANDAPKGGRLVLGRLSLSQVPAFGPHGRTLVPEVVRGEVGSHDPAAAQAIDLYGLGCVAIEMACGSPPFADDDPEIESHGHALERPPRIADLRPDLPTELSDLVDWLLAKQPAMRPRSVTDVLAQVDSVIARLGNSTHAVRVLIVDDDTARARWLWSLARRAHPAAIVEIATEGTDAAHKLNRDQPDLVFVDATLRGVMNALELCMYARGLEGGARGQIFLIGAVSDKDRDVFADARIHFISEDGDLPTSILDRVRAAAAEPDRRRKVRKTVSG